MKQLFFLLLLAGSFANAQIVSIPNINFKLYLLSASPTNNIAKNAAGDSVEIDTNHDGLIQQSEVNVIAELYTGYLDLSSTTGLNSFINLKKFSSYNSSSSNSFSMSGFNYLEEVYIYSNYSSSFNFSISNCPSLIKIDGNGSYYSSLYLVSTITNCPNLKYIDSNLSNSFNQNDFPLLETLKTNSLLNSYNFSSNLYLKNLYDIYNVQVNITDLVINNCPLLENFTLYAGDATIVNNSTFIGLANLKSIEFIYTNDNGVGLHLDNFPNLEKVIINRYGQIFNIPFITFAGSNNLKDIEIGYPYENSGEYSGGLNGELNLNNKTLLNTLTIRNNKLLTSLKLNNCSSLTSLVYDIPNNPQKLNNLELSGCTSLSSIVVSNQNLTSLDLSSCGALQYVYCNNNNLNFISFKNNVNEAKSFLGNPNLTYICADEAEQNAVQYILNVYEMYNTCNVGDYCSFTPNGNYNTITGTATYDNENNGCDANDEVFQYLRLNLVDTNGANAGSTFTNVLGSYTFYANAGDFTMTPQMENPGYYSISPASVPVNFADNLNNTAANNFCITPNGVHNDLEVVIAPLAPARPGFDAQYKITYKNKGNQPLSGDIVFTYDDAVLDYQSINPSSPVSLGSGTITVPYTNLLPFENKSFTVTLNVNAPTETPAVNNGDVLAFSATITPLAGDEIPADNAYAFNQTVVGSFDPNDITCIEGTTVDPSKIGEYLHYIINFENTGTAAAENIVVKTDINPAQFDIATLQTLNASHNVYTRIKDNKAEFVFKDIQLDNTGHGYIIMKIKSKSSLNTNDVVSNKADIYFDYNFPVATNNASTTFAVLNNASFIKDNSVSVHPNPAHSIINISSTTAIKSIELFDVQGRLLQTKIAGDSKTVLDITDKTNGVYFLKITTSKGIKVEKIVKE